MSVAATLAGRMGLGRRELRGAFRGSREQADAGTRAIVVGGGLAGTSAACVLAERGVAVTLLEANDYLGGRLGAWTEHLPDGQSYQMERAVPTIFGHYYNVRSILRRVDPELATLRRLGDHQVIGPDGAVESFARLPTTAPLNLLSLLRRSPFFRLSDLRGVNPDAFRALVNFDPMRSYGELDEVSAGQYLDRLGLPGPAREMFFRVFSRALFSPEEGVSAAEMIARLHFYFLGNPEGMCFDVFEEPTSDVLWRPMERYLARHDVDVQFGARATSVTVSPQGAVSVSLESGKVLEAEALVLAVTVDTLRSILETSPDLRADADFATSITTLRKASSFAVHRLFLDRPVDDASEPFVATAGLGMLDAIAVYERFEGESRRWALRTGGSVVQLHAYALDARAKEETVRSELLGTLRALHPELEGAQVVHESFLMRDDQPAFAPGSHARRPRVVTPYGTVVLAGDFVKLPFPTALMERAAASGILAANQLLDRWDVRGEAVWSIPPRGFMASLRFARGEADSPV